MVSDHIPGLRVVAALVHPEAHFRALREALTVLYLQRNLIMAMANREISNRFAGQMLGSFWVVVHPLFLMGLMVFVFGVVFKQRIGGTFEMPRDYTVYILSGLAAWLSLSPVLSTSATSVTSNANIIKQFTFDARILPAKDILVSTIVWLISIGVVIIYTLVSYQSAPFTYFLIPIVAVIHFMTAMGCAWALAALSVFLRDIKNLLVLATTAMIYLLPIVYLPTWIPKLFLPIVYMNPLSYMIWVYQDVFYYGRIEHPWAWVVASLVALFAFTAGYRLFRRLQPMFGGRL